jgi:hypothetical protein
MVGTNCHLFQELKSPKEVWGVEEEEVVHQEVVLHVKGAWVIS